MYNTLRIENHTTDCDGFELFEFNLGRKDKWKSIVEWYSSWASGDDIRVFMNGVRQDLDINGYIKDNEIDSFRHSEIKLSKLKIK